uniref:Cytochrome c biogenesis protein CcsB n=1 Tax=Plumaria plumosa TaxID=189642 RepID=A0A4D6X294_9FLOR|nr:cytochrome c biogenesis protein ccs1 [Plumaria plumosa]
MNFVNKKNIVWNLMKILANLNFAIFILLLIAACSFIGSIIEQDQSLLYYQTNYPIQSSYLFNIDWHTIIDLGLDHLYQTWWFILILFIFSISLMVCSFSVQLPSLRNARRWKFVNYKSDNKLQYGKFHNNLIQTNSWINIIYALNQRNFYVFYKNNCIYAYKGLLGRIAPIFVHISIILTLIGSMLSVFTGSMSQEMIVKGELFHIKNTIRSGSFNSISRDFIAYIDDFFIDYNLDHSVKQFFSKIFILDNSGKILNKKMISVNSPLIFKGFTFYQTDWQINAIRFQLSPQVTIQRQLNKISINSKTCWFSSIPFNSSNKYLFIIFNLKKQVFLYDIVRDEIFNIRFNEKFNIKGIEIIAKELIVSTGLQIKFDPGIYIVYFAFLLIMISTSLSYISYSQIWVNLEYDLLQVTGLTNRAVLFFEEDINQIYKTYKKHT